MAFTVGLTGGIGSGKTTVGEMFGSKGADLVDTDAISHQLTASFQPAIVAIASKFGAEFIAEDGSLDRVRMRQLVFSDISARRRLEGILHPLIREESERQIRDSSAPYVVVVVPLLIESGAYRGTFGRLLVVDCEPETQVRRVMERSALSRNEILSVMASQVSRQRRLAEADDIIFNDGDREELRAQIDVLHLRYLGLARPS